LPELRETERRVISVLKKIGRETNVEKLVETSGIQDSILMRSIFSLSEKGLVELKENKERFAHLTEEGTVYLKNGLPERQILEATLKKGGEMTSVEVSKETGLKEGMINIALGWLRRKGWVSLASRDGKIIIVAGKSHDQGVDEKLLAMFEVNEGLKINDLPPSYEEAISLLGKRNLIETTEKTIREVSLTEKGYASSEEELGEVQEVSALTSDLLKGDMWKKVRFVPYDIKADPPIVYPGKKHVYLEFLEEVRRFLMNMGFVEAASPYVETEFWNFDVLFQAQDHPAREVHDSYALKDPLQGRLSDEGMIRRVRATHENGWITGSTGWQYKWNLDLARRLILRTQTTATSVRYLSENKEAPLKMFCISRNFRPDFLDATHSMEFYQCEGIVMDKGANFRNLLGFLTEFSKAFGIDEVRFKPGYFPFTEPSVEGFIYHPKLGWIECLPGGIFRPEVLKPLALKYPVLAWGIGIDRIAMASLGINDIRELFTKRLDWLREKPLR
jgi:phenylalanyl-tRNA synthetase alpha chain